MGEYIKQEYTLQELLTCYPYLIDFLASYGISARGNEQDDLEKYIEAHIEEHSISVSQFMLEMENYIQAMEAFLEEEQDVKLESISILAGYNKMGEKEGYDEITIYPSEVIAIVGPTGSGKSRLLADIEWTANKDTQTKRQILINGELPDLSWRYSVTNQLVAQLSQNMNFVIDVTVYEFLQMHAECKNIRQPESVIDKIIEAANRLAGEKFSRDTNVTSLSGGQSRALMIADTAILSSCPIVLIDEIENAGIDRKKALDLLLSEEKIVLMATHDPLLCLMADKRIVIENGGIKDVLVTLPEEKKTLEKLWDMDQVISDMRTKLRKGDQAIIE